MSATAILSDSAHRGWPLPRGPWIMRQTWHELLFAHWPLDPVVLAARIPPGLTLDTLDGRAYLGVIPFRMSDVAPRVIPAIPWLSAFAEMNVRTYVIRDGIPGVWFFSLDAANPIAVALARALFFLPYFTARMRCTRDGDSIRYASRRTRGHDARPATFAATYRPIGPVYHSAPGRLDHWLTERYCLYAASPRGALFRCDIHHARWPLQPAAAAIAENTMAAAAGFTLPDTPPHLRYAARQDVLVWAPRRVG